MARLSVKLNGKVMIGINRKLLVILLCGRAVQCQVAYSIVSDVFMMSV